MRVRDLVYETATALDSNRGRSLLTILGIVIGIAAVIAMTALIGGVKQSLVGELGLNQARLVQLYAWPGRTVTLDDLEALEELMPEYECLTASSFWSFEIKNETKKFDASVMGVLPSYQKVSGLKMAQGTFLTDENEDKGELVVVLDQNSVKQLYGDPNEEVVGKTVMINNGSYTIKGVTEATSALMASGGTVYVPYSTCATRLSGYWGVDDMMGLARESANMETIADKTRDTLIDYFNISDDNAEDAVYVYTMQSVIDELNSTMASFELLMTAVASISLLVGGIGIMNMMLTNVTERIREIGLRKALGARSSDITMQFLLESICLCLVGGIIGILVGYFGSFALTGLAGGVFDVGGEGNTIVPAIDMKSVVMATGISVGIGVLFGYYPARRASKLDPVESLHYQ